MKPIRRETLLRAVPLIAAALTAPLALGGASFAAVPRTHDAPSGFTAGKRSLLDDRRGAFRGVRLGDSERRVVRFFGRPTRGHSLAPLGMSPAEAGVPLSIPSGPASALKYRDVVFLTDVVGDHRAFVLMVTENGVRTTRGIAIGDSMSKARRAYRLKCVTVVGDALPDGTFDRYPSCRTTLRKTRLRIWFGRDPIRSITILSLAHA